MATASLELLADSSQIRTATKDLDRLSAAGANTDSVINSTSASVAKFTNELKASGKRVAANGKVFDAFGLEVKSATLELERLKKEAQEVGSQTTKLNGRLTGVGRSAGQAGIQIQQFVGQIQGGQSAMLALSQQGADLGFVLGAPLAGAIIGIGASLAGFLLPNIISSSTEISELVERINDLDEAVEKTTAQNRVLAQSNEEEVASLSKRNQQIAEQIELLQERLRLQSTAGTGTDTGQFAVPRSAEENQRRYAESIKETNKELELLRGELDTNNQDIIKLSKSTSELGKNTDVAASKVQGIAQSLQTQIIALQGGAQAAEVYALTQKAIADNTQSQLPTLIELVNQKYELKRAQEAAAESARQEAAAQKELESNYQQFLRIVEQAEQAETRKAERQLQNFESLKQQIVLQQQQILLENEQYELRRNLLALGDGANQSQIDEITALTEQMQALRFEAELVGASLENSMQNIGLNALDSLSQGLANAITEGESLRDVIGGIANSILNELLTAIIRYAIGSAAQALIGQTTATTAAVTSAATIAAAATPAAIAMNIATLGGAATAAAASSAAAIPTMTGLIASSGIAGFEKGGYTGNYGTKEVAGVVHGQEFVMNARVTRQNRGALEAMNRGESMGGNTYVNVVNNATNSNVSTEERQDAQGNRVIDIVVANINQRGKIHKAMTQTTTASNRI